MSKDEERFGSSEELLKALRERSDDFESVELYVTNEITLTLGSDVKVYKDCCGVIRKFDGSSMLIHRDELESLLNDGILTRMSLPIRLTPGKWQ